jgi:hypothetical protein
MHMDSRYRAGRMAVLLFVCLTWFACARAEPLNGVFISGFIENGLCTPQTGCVFSAGSDPTKNSLPGTFATRGLSDSFASVSGSGSLATGDMSLAASVNGAPNSGCSPECGNPAGITVVMFDTLTFHFSGPNADVTVRMSGTGSTAGPDVILAYDFGPQGDVVIDI